MKLTNQFASTFYWRYICAGLLLMLSACDSSAPTAPGQTDANEVKSERNSAGDNLDLTSGPPGFTDAPPPPPSSNTLVLSGGVLLLETPITDSVIVITDGLVRAWGRRGEVEMPNDSIGVDMRAKWLRPTTALASGETADLKIFDSFPADSSAEPTGTIIGQEVALPAAD